MWKGDWIRLKEIILRKLLKKQDEISLEPHDRMDTASNPISYEEANLKSLRGIKRQRDF